MTDDTGMLQHAIFSIPRYDDGYCLDDNARALLLMALLEEAGGDDPAVVRQSRLAVSRLSSITPSIERPGASGTSCRTRGTGWSPADRRTARGEPCGRSAPSSDGRAIPVARVSPAISSTPPFLR